MTQREPTRDGIGGDEVGIVIATICLIHCVFISLLAVFVPWFLSCLGSTQGLHQGLASLSLFVAVLILWPGFRLHHKRRVLVYGGMGLALLLVGALAPPELCCTFWLPPGESVGARLTPLGLCVTAATPVGCALLVTAHVTNRRYLHSHKTRSR